MSLWQSTFQTKLHYRRRLSLDARGVATYGPAVEFYANLQPQNRLIRNSTGEQVASSASIWCNAALEATDKIYLPGSNTAKDGDGKSILQLLEHRQLLTGVIDHVQVVL